MIINDSKAGIPNIVNNPTVITLIGMAKSNGDTIKLYPYSIKALTIILLIIDSIFFSIRSPQLIVC